MWFPETFEERLHGGYSLTGENSWRIFEYSSIWSKEKKGDVPATFRFALVSHVSAIKEENKRHMPAISRHTRGTCTRTNFHRLFARKVSNSLYPMGSNSIRFHPWFPGEEIPSWKSTNVRWNVFPKKRECCNIGLNVVVL